MVRVFDDWAVVPPLLLIVWPVKTFVVEVPELFVTVSEIVYVPVLAYVWVVVGAADEDGASVAKVPFVGAMVPRGDEEAEPSRETVRPIYGSE